MNSHCHATLKPTAWVDQSAAHFRYTPYQRTRSAAHRALPRMWLGQYEYHPRSRFNELCHTHSTVQDTIKYGASLLKKNDLAIDHLLYGLATESLV